MQNISEISENCISCALQYNFWFSAFISCPCLSVECIKGSGNHKIKVSFSYWQLMVSVLLICLISYEVVYCGYWSKMHYSEKNNAVLTMTYFLNFLYYFRAAFTMIVNTAKRNTAKETLEQLSTLLRSYTILQNQDILSRSLIKKLGSRFLYLSLGIVFATILYAIVLFGKLLESNWSLVQILVTILTFYVDNRIVMFLVSKSLLYKSIILEYQNRLIECLQKRHKTSKNIMHANYFKNSSDLDDQSLEQLIKLTTKHYYKISNNLLRWNNFYSPTFVIWSLIGTCMIVISIFAIYVSVLRKNAMALSFQFIELQIRIYISMALMIYGLMEIGSIDDLKDDLLQYLNKYPASILTICESEQLEILMTCFNIQNVVVRASDIFNIRREWLASISGVMVTYALVSMQFESAWKN